MTQSLFLAAVSCLRHHLMNSVKNQCNRNKVQSEKVNSSNDNKQLSEREFEEAISSVHTAF